ncbi:MAG: formate dehydrogenase subunit alpha [Methanotrichaceae archaeon]|nr:formate dehydrogenase subunit alpha [Methanotrichaceae archaeon]
MPKSVIASVCPYCGAGCGFYINVEKDKATGIEYMTGHPASEGALCAKGNAALEILYHQDRLVFPLKRKGEGWTRITWDKALELVARGFGEAIKIHGSGSIGFLASSKCTNEENYLIEKLARCLGSPNVDNCARLCHAPTIVGLNRALGAAGMTNPISDLANSKCIFIIGSNLAENHPILSRWIHRARDAGAVVIVADPRLTHTAWMADIFLQIKPGTDVALLNGMAGVIIREGLADHDFISKLTIGYEDLVKTITAYTPERVSEITGVSANDIVKASKAYAKSPTSAIVYSMGITQHTTGTDNVQALSNLALICGHMGKQGAGIFPLRGQNNVQGACDMGALAEFYPGYRKADDPETTKIFSQAWGIEFLPVGRGLTATEMIDAAMEGKIKAMYIVGEDPINSDPNASHAREALKNLDFLVVQDIFMTATARLADIVLPASAWAEKEGTYTSTERRVQWSNKAIEPPAEAKADLEIICEVAGKLGLQFAYPDAAAVLSEINRLVPAYGGITRDRLTAESLIWPCPSADQPGTPILHSQGFKLPGGKAAIVPIEYKPPAEESSLEYPFILTTGRVAVHHNAGSMTRRSPSLLEREPDLFVEINSADAVRLSISDGEEIAVTTPRGKITALARLTNRVGKGVVFMPFHFPETNILTSDARDAEARIPEFKISICKIARRC